MFWLYCHFLMSVTHLLCCTKRILHISLGSLLCNSNNNMYHCAIVSIFYIVFSSLKYLAPQVMTGKNKFLSVDIVFSLGSALSQAWLTFVSLSPCRLIEMSQEPSTTAHLVSHPPKAYVLMFPIIQYLVTVSHGKIPIISAFSQSFPW